ncbi:MAG: DUF1573 domain-containing protein [Calditrichaeota bacterium]|nr:DUF1573 domain-containing protein [Calditrichota bacterium]HQU73726.1 DUF1573 domain-containing protein [Calditrichia bacterium]
MKHIILTFALLLLGAGLYAQESDGIEFLHDKVYNMGVVTQGDMLEGKIEFINKSGATLTIKDIQTSCGCTAVTPPQKMYAAGETASIPFSINTDRFTGPIHKSIKIVFEEEAVPAQVVMVEANVRTDLNISPKYINLPSLIVNPDTLISEFFEIENKSDHAILIKKISANNPAYTLSPASVEIPAGKSQLVKLDFVPKEKGRFNGRVLVEADHQRQSLLELRVFINVTDPAGESE